MDLRSVEDVLLWQGNANMEMDLRSVEDVLLWQGNANMAFDLRPTKDVLLWPGNVNIAFDLRSAKDVFSWPGIVPRDSTIFLNTKTSLKGLGSKSLAISHSLRKWVVQYGSSLTPRSISLTLNIDIVILSPTAILAFLQSITALAVAKNPLPTSKGHIGSFPYQ
nr:hypothetical protein [Tanacetum cinerariifolium]